MKSVEVGVQGYENSNLYISSSGRDKVSRLPLKTTWTVIKSESSLKLQAKVLSKSPLSQIKIQVDAKEGDQPKVKIQSDDLVLGDFTVADGLLIVKELPPQVLNDLLIIVSDCSSLHSFTLSIEAYEHIKFSDAALDSHKNDMRLALFDISKFNYLIG